MAESFCVKLIYGVHVCKCCHKCQAIFVGILRERIMIESNGDWCWVMRVKLTASRSGILYNCAAHSNHDDAGFWPNKIQGARPGFASN